MTTEKKIIIGAVLVMLIGLGFFIWSETKPKPGIKFPDLGRTHIEEGTVVQYNSNPPTSGNHYPVWVTAGVYDAPKDDRNLVHSLEHGYIIMSYNCSFKQSSLLIPSVQAQGTIAPGADSTPSATLPPEFQTSDCQDLAKKLSDIYNAKGKHKLIVIPRPNLDARIALTAWTYLDKFNTFDEGRINKFIDALRDQGPEKTIEP